MKSISASDLKNLVDSGKHIDLIDVRTPIEYRAIHVTVARNVPLDRLDTNAVREPGSNSSDPLFVVCRSGGRSRQLVKSFWLLELPTSSMSKAGRCL